jgi:hypothetical protein
MKGWWLAGVLLVLGIVPPGLAMAQDVVFETPVVGDRRVILRWNKAPGDTFTADERARCKVICGECCESRAFGGYQIWRGSSADTTKLVLVRTYSVFDTTWTFVGDERVFSDPDSVLIRGCGGTPGLDPDFCDPLTGRAVAPFNGFPYWYSVSWFDSEIDTVGVVGRVYEHTRQDRGTGLRAEPVQPAAPSVTSAPVLGNVRVVPNPYDPSDPANRLTFRGEERIQFIHLPSPSRVKIYTISGDLIQELENNDSDDAIDWNLRNADGRDVVPGIYMYVAETADGSQRRNGHFVIIR